RVAGHAVWLRALRDARPQCLGLRPPQLLHLAQLEPHAAAALAVIQHERIVSAADVRLAQVHAQTDGAGVAGVQLPRHSRIPFDCDLSSSRFTSWNAYTRSPDSVTSGSAMPRTTRSFSAASASSGVTANSVTTSTAVSLPPR